MLLQKRQAEEHKQLAEKFEAQCNSEQRTVEELRATVKNYEAQVEAVGADMQRFKDQHDMILGTLTKLKNNQNTSAPACRLQLPGVLAHMNMLEGVAMYNSLRTCVQFANARRSWVMPLCSAFVYVRYVYGLARAHVLCLHASVLCMHVRCM